MPSLTSSRNPSNPAPGLPGARHGSGLGPGRIASAPAPLRLDFPPHPLLQETLAEMVGADQAAHLLGENLAQGSWPPVPPGLDIPTRMVADDRAFFQASPDELRAMIVAAYQAHHSGYAGLLDRPPSAAPDLPLNATAMRFVSEAFVRVACPNAFAAGPIKSERPLVWQEADKYFWEFHAEQNQVDVGGTLLGLKFPSQSARTRAFDAVPTSALDGRLFAGAFHEGFLRGQLAAPDWSGLAPERRLAILDDLSEERQKIGVWARQHASLKDRWRVWGFRSGLADALLPSFELVKALDAQDEAGVAPGEALINAVGSVARARAASVTASSDADSSVSATIPPAIVRMRGQLGDADNSVSVTPLDAAPEEPEEGGLSLPGRTSAFAWVGTISNGPPSESKSWMDGRVATVVEQFRLGEIQPVDLVQVVQDLYAHLGMSVAVDRSSQVLTHAIKCRHATVAAVAAATAAQSVIPQTPLRKGLDKGLDADATENRVVVFSQADESAPPVPSFMDRARELGEACVKSRHLVRELIGELESQLAAGSISAKNFLDLAQDVYSNLGAEMAERCAQDCLQRFYERGLMAQSPGESPGDPAAAADGPLQGCRQVASSPAAAAPTDEPCDGRR